MKQPPFVPYSTYVNPFHNYQVLIVELFDSTAGSDTQIVQKTFDVGVVPGSAVKPFFVDDDLLQKSFFDQCVQTSHGNEIFKFRIQGFMYLLGGTGTKVVDELQ